MDEAIEADRVIVMDDGKILTEGTPREVFSQVELLKKHQLDVPQSTELTHRLKAMGVDLPDCTPFHRGMRCSSGKNPPGFCLL